MAEADKAERLHAVLCRIMSLRKTTMPVLYDGTELFRVNFSEPDNSLAFVNLITDTVMATMEFDPEHVENLANEWEAKQRADEVEEEKLKELAAVEEDLQRKIEKAKSDLKDDEKRLESLRAERAAKGLVSPGAATDVASGSAIELRRVSAAAAPAAAAPAAVAPAAAAPAAAAPAAAKPAAAAPAAAAKPASAKPASAKPAASPAAASPAAAKPAAAKPAAAKPAAAKPAAAAAAAKPYASPAAAAVTKLGVPSANKNPTRSTPASGGDASAGGSETVTFTGGGIKYNFDIKDFRHAMDSNKFTTDAMKVLNIEKKGTMTAASNQIKKIYQTTFGMDAWNALEEKRKAMPTGKRGRNGAGEDEGADEGKGKRAAAGDDSVAEEDADAEDEGEEADAEDEGEEEDEEDEGEEEYEEDAAGEGEEEDEEAEDEQEDEPMPTKKKQKV